MKIAFLLGVLVVMGCSSQDGKFNNIEPIADKALIDVLKWRLFTDREEWPQWIDYPQFKLEHERVTGEAIAYTVINHATVLIQWRGLNILTDPIYSKRASPFSWAGPARVRNPGVAFEDLPKIDIVVISHNHYDHLDTMTLERLKEKHDPKFFVGLKNGALLKDIGISKIKEFDWWESEKVGELVFHFVPAQHWSARGLFDKRETLWGGFSIKGPEGKHVYFAGDTGYGKFFKMIQEKLGAVDLAFLPIGAYEPRWMMKPQHMNPAEAIKAHVDIESKNSVGIHFETFQLTNESFDAPRETLNKLWKESQYRGDFIAPVFGKQVLIEKL